MPIGQGQRLEAELRVEAVGVLRDELLAAEILEPRVRREERQRGFGEAVAAVGLQPVDVAPVGERRGVGDDPDEADLRAVGGVEPDVEGVFERA